MRGYLLLMMLILSPASLVQGFSRNLARALKPKSMSFRCYMSSNNVGKKRVVFLGTPDVAARSLELLVQASKKGEEESGFEVVAVVSQPPAPSGRNKKLTPSPVQVLAEKAGIPVMIPKDAKDVAFLDALEALAPDLCVTAAYGNFLPKRFLAIPKLGTLNIHPSLLPKYRGAAPVQRCLENGDVETGVSVAVTVLKMDAGPLLRQIVHPLNGNEKAPELLMQMFELGTAQLLEALPSFFAQTATTKQQDDSCATPAAKLSVSEAKVDFSIMNAATIHYKVRGFASWPGTWSSFQVIDDNAPSSASASTSSGSALSESQRIKIITSILLEPLADSVPASERDRRMSLVKLPNSKKEALRVVCGDGSVLGIVELQPPSKNAMDAKSFMNGLRGAKLIWSKPPDDEEVKNS